MAGYSKGIVDTRKLNKNSKAKLGRGGDTKIREVDNRESHVNALEAYLIDVNGKAGEEYAKRVGAGTVNPLTGMPEYHPLGFYGNQPHDHEAGGKINLTGPSEEQLESLSDDDPYSYEALKDVTGETLTEFDPTLGEDDVQYFEGIFTDKPFDFLERQQDLTTRGLTSAYSDTMGALGSQEKTLGLQGEGLTAQQTALGRTTGRGYAQATGAAATATSKSGLATSGTITQGLETQKKQLFQDYSAGMGDIQRERAGIDISMGDIQRERETALDTLTLGKDTAALDLSAGIYTEQQRQLDEYWDMIGMRQQVG